MPKKVEYPEWVMTHKKKGTYINRVGDKYYLYAAHSERIKGTGCIFRLNRSPFTVKQTTYNGRLDH